MIKNIDLLNILTILNEILGISDITTTEYALTRKKDEYYETNPLMRKNIVRRATYSIKIAYPIIVDILTRLAPQKYSWLGFLSQILCSGIYGTAVINNFYQLDFFKLKKPKIIEKKI